MFLQAGPFSRPSGVRLRKCGQGKSPLSQQRHNSSRGGGRTQLRGVASTEGLLSRAKAVVPPPPDLLPPPAAYEKAAVLGAAKAALPASKIFVLGLLGGAYIALGSLLVFSVGMACPGLAGSNPGLQKLLMGAFGLPTGLLLVLVCGAELFTGNTALISAAVYEGKASLKAMTTNWVVSYLGNLAGSLAVVYLVAATGVMATSPAPLAIAAAKTSLTFSQAFARGILANVFVCSAVWMAGATSSLPGKIVAVWFPIAAFVAAGMEHCVANMFTIPMGIALGAPVTVQQFLLSNLLPVTLGNIVGGLCVGTVYAVCYGSLGKSLE